MTEEHAKTWAGEAVKAIAIPGALATSVFGIAGALIGWNWFESENGSPVCIPGFCEPPELPIVGPVYTPQAAAFWFGLAVALATLAVCGGYLLVKGRTGTNSS